MKMFKHLIVGLTISILTLTTLNAQTPPSPVPSTNAAPDLFMLTNHASLVGYALKQVKGAKVNISSGAQANNWENAGFLPITNDVKSVDILADIISPYWWGLQLTDTKAYVQLNAQLWNTDNPDDAFNNYYYSDAYVLFNSYNGGQPQKTPYGYWTLPDEATQLRIELASQIRIKVPGLTDARLVVQDENGNDYGVQINVNNGEMWFPSVYAGANSTIVLTRQYQNEAGYWYSDTKAYDLRKNVEVPLTQVMVHVLLRDGEDTRSFRNIGVMDATVYSYQGYGKLPLVIATYDSLPPKPVTVSVHSTEGKYATAYQVEDQQTKKSWTVTVPPGQAAAKIEIPTKGVFWIVPIGLELKPGYYWYGGGKG